MEGLKESNCSFNGTTFMSAVKSIGRLRVVVLDVAYVLLVAELEAAASLAHNSLLHVMHESE